MALESTYGEVSSTSYVKGLYDELGSKYQEPMLSLLPTGPAWDFDESSEMHKLILALSYTFNRIEKRGIDLFNEVDPRTMSEMLSTWETFLNLPGDNPSPPATLAERRSDIHSLFLGFGDPNSSFFETLAKNAINDLAKVVSLPSYDVFTAGDVAGSPLTGAEWAYVWLVSVFSSDYNDLLEWAVERLTPAHTLGIINYLTLQEYPNPGATNLNSMAYYSDLWVGVGDKTGGDSYIIISIDGKSWEEKVSPKNVDLRSVTYDTINDLWISCGESDGADSFIITSPDGVTWTERATPKNFNLYSIASNGIDLITAVGASDGSDSLIVTSPDGINWIERSNPAATHLYAICYCEFLNLWIACGAANSGYSYIITSPDGINWTRRTASENLAVRAIATNNIDLIIAAGDGVMYQSADGVTWTSIDNGYSSGKIYGIVYNSKLNLWIAAGDEYITSNDPPLFLTSEDGTNWTNRSTSTKSYQYNCIATNNEYKFISSGNYDGKNAYLTMLDFGSRILPVQAKAWVEYPNPKAFDLNSVTNNMKGLFVATGDKDGVDGYIVTSGDDGLTWTERANPKNIDLNSVIYDAVNNQFVAVGDLDGVDAYIVIGSSLGTVWTEQTNPKNFDLNSVVYDEVNNQYVAVGSADGTDAYIVTSSDGGLTWTERANPKNVTLVSVTYGAGLFVAVGWADGTDAYIVTSSDGGLTWTERANPKNIALKSVAYNGLNLFVAVGNNDGTDAYIVTSGDDGLTWTERANPKNAVLNGVIYYSHPLRPDDSLWIACGNVSGSDAYMLVSSDGINWAEVNNPAANTLNGLAQNEFGKIVCVGNDDTVDAYIVRSEN